MPKEIYKRLLAVQTELVAPKGQYNSFGKYNYRSAEDILEAVKPLLKKYELTLTISDEPVHIEGRFYIKATSTLRYGDEEIAVSAYAREADSKSGMDAAQLTGATSSYCRKYSLSGLFCIDDNADPDALAAAGVQPSTTTNKNTIDKALKALSKCKTTAELKKTWELYANDFGNDETFRKTYMQTLATIKNGTNG